jgi:glyoxylase-like metal-dependent hydrolase (beta-lactamase superfamily II)
MARRQPGLRAHTVGLLWLAGAMVACGPERPSEPQPTHDSADGVQTRSLEHFGEDLDHAVELAPGIFQARGTGNAQMIATPAGRVIFDTGLPTQSDRLRELLDAAASGPITHVIASHAHLDHTGGAKSYMDEGTKLVVHRDYLDVQEYLFATSPSLMRRNKFFYPESVPDLPLGLLNAAMSVMYPIFEPDIVVDEEYAFELGGVRFEVIHTPGAEGSDSICLWLPERRILFSGDFFGPIFPMFPNLTTIRGERFRFAMPYVRSLEKVLELQPEMIVPSHFEPIEGWEENIRPAVQKMRDATAYVHDATVTGMNEGKDVFTLMREIQLPPELALSEAHGTVRWTVRGIFEGYATWFHFDSTTQLYGVPARNVYAEVAGLAGAGALAERAARHVAAGRPVEALHLLEMALAAKPKSAVALRARLDALELLRERSGGINHHETIWLDTRIAETREALGS